MRLGADCWRQKYHVIVIRRRDIMRIFAKYSDRSEIPDSLRDKFQALSWSHIFTIFSRRKKELGRTGKSSKASSYSRVRTVFVWKKSKIVISSTFSFFKIFSFVRNHDSIYIWSKYCRYSLPKKRKKIIFSVKKRRKDHYTDLKILFSQKDYCL